MGDRHNNFNFFDRNRNNKYETRQKQSTVQLTAYEQQVAFGHVTCLLEPLEGYMKKTGRNSHNQLYGTGRTIKDDSGTAWNLQTTYLTQLLICTAAFDENLTPPPIKNYAKQEFYKWIDYSGINPNNCPRDLAHFLIEANNVLDGDGKKIMNDSGYFRANKDKPTQPKAQDSLELFHSIQGFDHENRDMKKSLDGLKFNEGGIQGLRGDPEKGRRIFEEIEKRYRHEHNDYYLYSLHEGQNQNATNIVMELDNEIL